MPPKRPTSCLAYAVLPVLLLLLLVVIGGYGIKFFFPQFFTRSNVAEADAVGASTSTSTVLRSRLPADVPTTTRVEVAVATSNGARESLFDVNVAGEAQERGVPDAWTSSIWRQEGISLTPPVDGVTSSAWQVVGDGWRVKLQTHSGAKWLDPVIWGVFNDGRVAIVAHREHRALLAVSKTGVITVIEVLDDDLAPLAVVGNSAWFVQTKTPSDDTPREQLPTGPSFLVRITKEGVRTTVLQDPEFILSVVPAPLGGALAYVTNNGVMSIVDGSELRTGPKGWTPQLWINTQVLLVSHKEELAWIDISQPTKLFKFATFPNFVQHVRISPSP